MQNHQNYVTELRKKAFELREQIFADERITKSAYKNTGIFKDNYVFLSVCNTKKTAAALIGTGRDLNAAWSAALKKAESYVLTERVSPVWVRADIVTSVNVMQFEHFNEYLSSTRRHFCLKGVSFDTSFNTALLPEQLNGYFIKYGKYYLHTPPSNIKIPPPELNKSALKRYFGKDFTIPEQIAVFSCKGYIHDGKVLPLCDGTSYHDSANYGIRDTVITSDDIKTMIITAANNVLACTEADGRFLYEYHAASGKIPDDYNSIRHAGTLICLCQYAEVIGTANLPESERTKIDAAFGYMFDNFVITRPDGAKFVTSGGKVMIGGGGIAVIALSLYNEVFGTDRYAADLAAFADGIIQCQDGNGTFNHVLTPDLEVITKFRTQFFDGEAAYALARAYRVTNDTRYLTAVKAAVEYFMANDWAKYRDHWYAYVLNELSKCDPDPRYRTEALHNMTVNRSRMHNNFFGSPVTIELLAQTHELYLSVRKANRKGADIPLPENFNEEKFIKTLKKRIEHGRTAYFLPETAMFMREPEHAVGAFFERADSFRIRIDDNQHFIGGYAYVLKNFWRFYAE